MWCYGRNKERVELDLWFSSRDDPHPTHTNPIPAPFHPLGRTSGNAWAGFFFCHNLGDGCYWQVLVGARIAAKHSTIHNKDYPAPIVNRTMVETLRWMVALRIPKFRSGYQTPGTIPGPVDLKRPSKKTSLTFVCSIHMHLWRVERNYGLSHLTLCTCFLLEFFSTFSF